MAVVAYGLEAFATTVFEGRAEYLRRRHTVIDTDAGLRERRLQKLATMSEAIRQGFQKRGTDTLTSALAAELAMTVFRVAITRWLAQEGERRLSEIIAETLSALQVVAADIPAQP